MAIKTIKIVIMYIILLTTSLLLGGCFPDGKPSSSNDVKSPIINESDDYLDVTLADNLIIKSEIPEYNADKLMKCKISYKEFDTDWTNSFLSTKNIIENNEWNNDLFPEYKAETINCDDGSYISTDMDVLRFYDTKYMERDYGSIIYGSTTAIRPDLTEIYTKTELENLDKTQAIQMVSQEIEKLDISVVGVPDVIVLDYETMKSEWTDYETKDGSPAKQWEKDDEAYFIIYDVLFDDVGILNTSYMDNDLGFQVSGSYVFAVVSQDGIICFECSGIYDYDNSNKSDIVPISLDTALEQVKNKYKNVILTDPITISKIELKYVPIINTLDPLTLELIPAWVFYAKQTFREEDEKGTFESDTSYTIILSAEDGQEIQ